MKRIILIITYLISIVSYIDAYDFFQRNYKGDTIFYNFISDDHKEVEVTSRTKNYNDTISYNTDTLYIPDTLIYEGKKIVVTDIGPLAFGKSYISVIQLPKTLNGCKESGNYKMYQAGLKFAGSYLYNDLSSIEVDKENPYFTSVDGVLYTPDRDTLLFCPPNRRGTYKIIEGTKFLGCFSFFLSKLDSIVMPESLVEIHTLSLTSLENLRTLRYPNSITSLPTGFNVSGKKLQEVIFGSGLTYMRDCTFRTWDDGSAELSRVVCLAVTPPAVHNLIIDGIDHLTLFVPRKSIGLYQQANGWKDFFAIEPIEPPVVAGVNEAEISWVTNAEASSYTLTIYLDEAQTKRLVTLSFDDRGYLTKMDFNPDVFKAPHRMPQEVNQLQEEDYPEFNKYLTFTVTGLTAHTKYYFVRQTLNAMSEVIDEETGSFETLPDGAPTGVNPLLFEPTPQKTFENGRLIINRNGNRYNVNGVKTE